MSDNDSSNGPRMYVPRHYAAANARALVSRYPFGTLVTTTAEGPYATQLPFVFETDEQGDDRLLGHMSRRNPQADTLGRSEHALALFQGPHAYISASWYKEKRQVPTWDYVTAQVRGRLEILDSEADRLFVLARTVGMMERQRHSPWDLEQAPEGMMDALLPLIRAFRLTITQIEGANKLNQSHPPGDRLRIVRHLVMQDDPGDLAIARLMAEDLEGA